MPTKFARYVKESTAGDSLDNILHLPIFHNTSKLHFPEILDSKKIKKTRCNLHNEELLYFFYGRPAYVPKVDNPDKPQVFLPISFVFDHTSIDESLIFRIYPFDSGAFKDKLYSKADCIPHETSHEAFILGNSYDLPKRIVKMFFGDLDNYFDSRVIFHKDIPFTENEVEQYLKVIKTNPGKDYDDRGCTIELSYRQDISFEGLLAIVLPSNAMEDRKVLNFLTESNTFPITYHPGEKASMNRVMGSMLEAVRIWLKRGGYLKK